MASIACEKNFPKGLDRAKSSINVKDEWLGRTSFETKPIVDYRKRKSASVPELLPKRRSLDKSGFGLATSHPEQLARDIANQLEKITEELPEEKIEATGIALPELTQLSIYCPAKDTDEDLQKFLEELLQDDELEAKQAEAIDIEPTLVQAEEQIDFLNVYYRRRSKWSRHEIFLLWQGIAKHGNNWTALRGTCEARSYDQIKDKGRRCLSLLGWRSNRRKLETSSAHAKRIAQAVLAGMRDE